MSDKVYHNDVNVEHDDATMTASVFDKAGKPLFSLSGYMIVGWYHYDNLFVNCISRVVRYPVGGEEYWENGGYNLYSREAGILLAADMKWINDTPAWDIAVQARDNRGMYGLLSLTGATILPFYFDDIEIYEGCRWPYMALKFYRNGKAFWYTPCGLLFPQSVEHIGHYAEEHSYHRVGETVIDCYEVIITEQQVDGCWRFVALRYLDGKRTFNYDSGYVFNVQPETDDGCSGVSFERDGLPGEWAFPAVEIESTQNI